MPQFTNPTKPCLILIQKSLLGADFFLSSEIGKRRWSVLILFLDAKIVSASAFFGCSGRGLTFVAYCVSFISRLKESFDSLTHP